MTDLENNVLKIKKSGYFDYLYYYNNRPDVLAAGVDGALHYLQQGWREGVNPSLQFNTRAYLKEHNPNKCPLIHFIENGEKHKDKYRMDGTSKRDLRSYFKHKKSRIADTVCYAYISDNYDNLISPKYVCPEWDYVCFTNNKRLINKKYIGVWKILPSQFEELDSKRNSGWHKTHPEKLFPNYKKSVWVDANTNILTDYVINEIKTRNSDLLVPIHYERDCIYDECNAVMDCGRDTPDIVSKTKDFLQKSGMPKNYGLNGTNIIFRKHTNKTIQNIDKLWWYCIKNYSKRDQLSFSYCLYKHNIKPSDIAINDTITDFINFYLVYHIQNKKDNQIKTTNKTISYWIKIHILCSLIPIKKWRHNARKHINRKYYK